MSTINPNLIFNFNLNECFSLSGNPQNIRYFQPLNNVTQVVGDPNNGIIGFRYNNSKNPGGLILKLGTIPGEVYHIFITGQVVIGNLVQMRVKNNCPEINLYCPQQWQMGCAEVRTMCFIPIGHQTDLTFSTDTHCFCNLAPYEFLISSLDIIPDSLMCQGYIEGPTGATGATGPLGPRGRVGPASGTPIVGFIGPPGPQGLQGFQGALGPQGARGNINILGPLGPPGERGPDNFQPGPTGPTGIAGSVGPLGTGGTIGIIGPTGPTGVSSFRTSGSSPNVIIGTVLVSWFRGSNTAVANNVVLSYQVTRSVVNLRILQFVSVGSTVNGIPVQAALTSQTLPADIRTSSGSESYFPCIIQVNGVTKQSAIKIGPQTITIYSDIQRSTAFLYDAVVFIPTQTFVYRIF